MTTADLCYAPIDKVRDELMTKNEVTLEDATSALINAMGAILILECKIDQLEARLRETEKDCYRAGHLASCLANGIQPD